jgi:hypothetical protein
MSAGKLSEKLVKIKNSFFSSLKSLKKAVGSKVGSGSGSGSSSQRYGFGSFPFVIKGVERTEIMPAVKY